MIYAGLIGFFFMEYVRPTSYIPAMTALHLNSIIPLSTVALSFITSGHATMSRLAADPNIRMIAGIIGLLWLSFMTADVQLLTWTTLTVVGGFALMTWVLGAEVTTLRKLKGIIVTLIVVHLCVAALNPLLFTDPETRHYVTSGSFLGDGNDFALSIDVIVPLCLFLLLDSKKTIVKLFWAGAILVLVAGVVVTQSRGGTVGLVCMAIYYWAKSQKKFQTGILVVVVVGLILALAPGNYFNRMRMIGDTTEGSASARLTAWGVAFQMAVDRPLTGVGAGHFGMKIGTEYRPAGMIGSGMTAHSIYFLALGELGFPGIILLLSFIGWNLRANQKLARELKDRASPSSGTDLQLLSSLSAALISFASAGAFLSALYYPHLYILAGLLTAGRHVVRQRMVDSPTATSSATPSREISLHWALRPAPRPSLAGPAAARPRVQPRAVGGRGGR
jgi:putative inorganic carbon (hco3(-)) transporter